MKSFVKSLFLYDSLYPFLQKTSLYKLLRKYYAELAAQLHWHPSGHMFVIGVTWTNGKTTTVNILHHLLNRYVGKTFCVSTAYVKFGDTEEFNATKMSSLDAFSLQKLLVRAKDEWCNIALIETTSHGLDQHRFAGIDFDMGILTNITDDHLDYHGGFDHYVAAKKKLFKSVIASHKAESYAVLPKDDPTGRKRDEELNFDHKLSFGVASNANVSAYDIVESLTGTRCRVSYLGQDFVLETNLLGTYNISNILAALSAVALMGVDMWKAIESLKSIDGVLGRMNKFEHNGVTYFVDYAHTEDALLKTLSYLSHVKWSGRLLVLSGSMWDGRDKGKRPKMWALLDQYADIVVLSDEDPWQENRLWIIDDVVRGIKNKKEGVGLFVLPERFFALQFITHIAKPWDTVFLAGKGHEEVMLTKYGKREWSDKRELEKILV